MEVVRDDAGVVTSAELVWMNRTGKVVRVSAAATPPTGVTVLGSLKVSDGRLVVEVNSEKRATAIARQIRARFGEDATLLEREVTDPVGEAFARARR